MFFINSKTSFINEENKSGKVQRHVQSHRASKEAGPGESPRRLHSHVYHSSVFASLNLSFQH